MVLNVNKSRHRVRRRTRHRTRRRKCAIRCELVGRVITCSKRLVIHPAVTPAPFRAAIAVAVVAMSPARAVALRFTFALSPSRVARARTAPSAVRRASLAVRADGKAAESGPLEERVDLRVGRVLSARKHEEAEKLVRDRSRSIDASDVCDVWVWCRVIILDARRS